MNKQKILDLIPERLREELINEVRELLQDKEKQQPSPDQVRADIEAWAKGSKNKNAKK